MSFSEAEVERYARHLVLREGAAMPEVDVRSHDDATILYTSGTTAAPKAARISHASLVAHTASIVHHGLRLGADDVVLGVGGFRVASGAIDVASLVTFVIFLFLLVQPLASAIGAIMSVNQALGALGMGTGLTHMEWFLRADGSAIVSEVGARPPGVLLASNTVTWWPAWQACTAALRPAQPAPMTATCMGWGVKPGPGPGRAKPARVCGWA